MQSAKELRRVQLSSATAKELCENLTSVGTVSTKCVELVNELLLTHLRTVEEVSTLRAELAKKGKSATTPAHEAGGHTLSQENVSHDVIVIAGLPESAENTPFDKRLCNDKASVTKVLEKGLGIATEVKDVKRMGKYSDEREKPRPIKATLLRVWDTRMATAKARNLRDSPEFADVYIRKLLSADELRKQRKRRQQKNSNLEITRRKTEEENSEEVNEQQTAEEDGEQYFEVPSTFAPNQTNTTRPLRTIKPSVKVVMNGDTSRKNTSRSKKGN